MFPYVDKTINFFLFIIRTVQMYTFQLLMLFLQYSLSSNQNKISKLKKKWEGMCNNSVGTFVETLEVMNNLKGFYHTQIKFANNFLH